MTAATATTTAAAGPSRMTRLRAFVAGSMLAEGWRRLTQPATPVLGLYQPEGVELRRTLRRNIVLLTIAFVGLIYGFLVALFPMFMYLYLGLPIIILALFVIWLLPQSEVIPFRQIEFCFWAFIVVLLLWPDYLAIALPGLPWITLQRLFLIPMALLLLVSVSVSPGFRADIGAALDANIWMKRMFLTFILLQVVTIPFSPSLSDTFTRVIKNLLAWTATAMVASVIFQKEGRIERFFQLLLMAMVFLAALATWEFRLQGLPWAGHIPSFLAVADESVQRILAGGARASSGWYRLQAVFATSLNFAEIMGIGTAIVVHTILWSRHFWQKLVLALYLIPHFLIIYGTDSRLGMIGFFGSFLLYALLWSIRYWRNNRGSVLGPALLAAYPFMILMFFGLAMVWTRLYRMLFGGGATDASDASRQAQWAALWPKLGTWPFGRGAGTSGDVLGFANAVGTTTVDSYYITVLLEYGVVGFFAYFGLLLTGAFTAVGTAYKSKSDEAAALLPIGVMLIMFVIIKGVLSQEGGHPLFFILIGIVFAFKRRQQLEAQGAVVVAR